MKEGLFSSLKNHSVVSLEHGDNRNRHSAVRKAHPQCQRMVQNSDSADSDEDGWLDGFLANENVVYLNNASQAPLTSDVIQAGVSALRRPPWEMHAEDDQEQVRELFSSLIEADPFDIAIMPSTAFAMTLAARNIQKILGNRTGRILVLQDQMCSAIYPWQEICSESNGSVQLKIVAHPESEHGWTQSIIESLDEEVLVACLPPLHWSDGSLIDLEKVSAKCKESNVDLIVDATQAVGIMPCSVKRIKPTLLACSVHKWLRGPTGMSLVYISPRVHEKWSPLDLHGRSRDLPTGKAWDASMNEMGPKGYPDHFYSDSRKFDGGGKPNPILLPLLRASMEKVVALDIEKAQAQLKALVQPLLSWASNNGYSISPGPHAFHLIGIRPLNRTPEELLEMSRALLQKDIIIAVRCGVIRISPYLDNTEADIQALIAGLGDIS